MYSARSRKRRRPGLPAASCCLPPAPALPPAGARPPCARPPCPLVARFAPRLANRGFRLRPAGTAGCPGPGAAARCGAAAGGAPGRAAGPHHARPAGVVRARRRHGGERYAGDPGPAARPPRRGRIEIMLNRPEADGSWEALVRNARRLRPGDVIAIDGAPDLPCRVLARERRHRRASISAPTRRCWRRRWTRRARSPCPPISPGRTGRAPRTWRTTRPSSPRRAGCRRGADRQPAFHRSAGRRWRRAGCGAPPSPCMSAPAPSCRCAPTTRARTGCMPNGAR